MDYGEEMDRTIASPRYPLWAPLELKSTKLVHVQQDFNPPWASQSSHSERGGEERVLHVRRTVSCGSDDPMAQGKIDKIVKEGKTVSCGSDYSLPDLNGEKIKNEKLNSDGSSGEESPNEIPDTPPPFPQFKLPNESKTGYDVCPCGCKLKAAVPRQVDPDYPVMPRCRAPGQDLLVDMSEGIGGKIGGKFQMLAEVEGIPTKLLLDSEKKRKSSFAVKLL
jgi:hypothetical protein